MSLWRRQQGWWKLYVLSLRAKRPKISGWLLQRHGWAYYRWLKSEADPPERATNPVEDGVSS